MLCTSTPTEKYPRMWAVWLVSFTTLVKLNKLSDSLSWAKVHVHACLDHTVHVWLMCDCIYTLPCSYAWRGEWERAWFQLFAHPLIPMELSGVCILSLHLYTFVIPKFALHHPYIWHYRDTCSTKVYTRGWNNWNRKYFLNVHVGRSSDIVMSKTLPIHTCTCILIQETWHPAGLDMI